jgi:hypothetical protein
MRVSNALWIAAATWATALLGVLALSWLVVGTLNGRDGIHRPNLMQDSRRMMGALARLDEYESEIEQANLAFAGSTSYSELDKKFPNLKQARLQYVQLPSLSKKWNSDVDLNVPVKQFYSIDGETQVIRSCAAAGSALAKVVDYQQRLVAMPGRTTVLRNGYPYGCIREFQPMTFEDAKASWQLNYLASKPSLQQARKEVSALLKSAGNANRGWRWQFNPTVCWPFVWNVCASFVLFGIFDAFAGLISTAGHMRYRALA